MPLNNSQNLLAELKDIHYPDPISWWPPAPGWWLVVLGAIIIIALCIFLLTYWVRKNRYRKHALKALNDIEPQTLTKTQYLDALAQLIKRTLQAAPKKGDEQLHASNEAYKAFLMKGMGEKDAEFFAITRYQRFDEDDIDSNALHETVKLWIKKHKL